MSSSASRRWSARSSRGPMSCSRPTWAAGCPRCARRWPTSSSTPSPPSSRGSGRRTAGTRRSTPHRASAGRSALPSAPWGGAPSGGSKMRTFLTILAVTVASVCTSSATAQAYPARAVTMVVPFSAGGPTDTIARIMAERMGKALGQTVVVENTTGAAGSIGVGRVARAAPDGYTLSIGHWSTHVVNGVIYNLPYDLIRDFEPVAMIASNPQLVVSKNAIAAKDLKDLIAWVKANESKVSPGTAGVGTASHVSAV